MSVLLGLALGMTRGPLDLRGLPGWASTSFVDLRGPF